MSPARRRPLVVFVLLIAAGGAGGLGGSIVGAAFGKAGLFAGGVIGGIVASPLAALLAGRLGWIDRADSRGAAAGAAIGFAAATLVAVNTLQSPVGPMLSTLLIGAGGLAGAWLSEVRRTGGGNSDVRRPDL